jgi:putative transposase
MAIQRYKPEQIVTLLRQIEVSIGNGKTTPQACNEAGITVQTFYLSLPKTRSRKA